MMEPPAKKSRHSSPPIWNVVNLVKPENLSPTMESTFCERRPSDTVVNTKTKVMEGGTLLVALIPGVMADLVPDTAVYRRLATSNSRRGPAAGAWSDEAIQTYQKRLGNDGVQLVTPYKARMKKRNGDWQSTAWNVRVDSGSFPVRDRQNSGYKPWPADAAGTLTMGQRLTQLLMQDFPDIHQAHQQALRTVAQHPALTGTDFTTVSLNGFRTAAHRDTSDVEGTYGVMLVLGTEGTHCDLLFPDHGLAVETRPGDVVIFRGRDALHANGPIQGTQVEPPASASKGSDEQRAKAKWKHNRISAAFYVKP